MVSDCIKHELRTAWSSVFIDGRNEHGAHVLPLPVRAVDESADVMLPENAEVIIAAAEVAGHVVGDVVVVTWRWVPTYDDEPGHFELMSPYHADLTALLHGTPHEQRKARVLDAVKT